MLVSLKKTVGYGLMENPMNNNNKMRLIRILFLSAIILLVLTSCWNDKTFYIEYGSFDINIEKIGPDKFRVFIFENERDKGIDYIDLSYGMSDMPTIQLCIPKDDMKKIFVIDKWHDVEQIHFSKYNYELLSPEKVINGEVPTKEKMERLDRVLAKIDSVRDSIPSITIQLNSRLTDLSVWKNGRYKGKISNQSH